MQKLNVRFTNETKEAIKARSEAFDLTDSLVARAALNIGLKELSNYHNANLDGKTFYDWIDDNQTA